MYEDTSQWMVYQEREVKPLVVKRVKDFRTFLSKIYLEPCYRNELLSGVVDRFKYRLLHYYDVS